MKQVVCDPNNKACMYRECYSCKSKDLSYQMQMVGKFSGSIGKAEKTQQNDNGEIEIKKVSTTVKDREHGTLETLKRELMKDLQISTSFQKKFIIMASDMPHGTF